VMAAIIAAGIAGIGVSFAYKSKSGPHELATIKAMSGPTKIQPDSPGGVADANQDASILDKTPQPTPIGLVDHQERPVDLAHQQAVAPRTILADAAGSMGAASVPVPPPPAAPQGQAAQANIQSYGIGALIEPKKVKTVSVRSDGTLLPNDTPPQMPQSAPSVPSLLPPHPAAPTASSGATTPKPATPTKSAARIVTTPKPQSIEQQISDDANDAPAAVAPAAPAPVKPKPAPAKPVKIAEAETTDTPAEAAGAAASGGSFAVQLAAPGSEQEAHDMTAKLAQKFGSALGSHHLTYHRAKVNDKTVFRVRAAGMSREEATGICQKLQASGGSCFVAKD
jgi:SPOR domain